MSEQIITKRCSKCKEIKPVSEFHKRSDRPSGYRSNCKICGKKYRQSEKGKEVYKHYAQTEKRKLSRKLYVRSERGKQVRRKACAKYQKTNKAKAKARTNAKQYRLRHPAREVAREAVKSAIRNNQIAKPKSVQCFYCPKSAQQYHHHKGYEPEHWLNVIPVCKKCHTKLHQNLGVAL